MRPFKRTGKSTTKYISMAYYITLKTSFPPFDLIQFDRWFDTCHVSNISSDNSSSSSWTNISPEFERTHELSRWPDRPSASRSSPGVGVGGRWSSLTFVFLCMALMSGHVNDRGRLTGMALSAGRTSVSSSSSWPSPRRSDTLPELGCVASLDKRISRVVFTCPCPTYPSDMDRSLRALALNLLPPELLRWRCRVTSLRTCRRPGDIGRCMFMVGCDRRPPCRVSFAERTSSNPDQLERWPTVCSSNEWKRISSARSATMSSSTPESHCPCSTVTRRLPVSVNTCTSDIFVNKASL